MIYNRALIKKNRNLSLKKLSNSSKAPINHLFGCHDYASQSTKSMQMMWNGNVNKPNHSGRKGEAMKS
jgi:hypothetical protein